jgi:hypothetical protein
MLTRHFKHRLRRRSRLAWWVGWHGRLPLTGKSRSGTHRAVISATRRCHDWLESRAFGGDCCTEETPNTGEVCL